MNKYYFVFGFMEPSESAQLGNLDDPESSAGIWISADSEESATKWGQEVAEKFLQKLYLDPNYSWKQLNYFGGVAQETPRLLNRHVLAATPEIKVGEWPDFESWIANRELAMKQQYEEGKRTMRWWVSKRTVIVIGAGVGLIIGLLFFR